MTEGLHDKYRVIKTSGEPVDPDAVYFVLRLDTDRHARLAALTYARSVTGENPELCQNLYDELYRIAGVLPEDDFFTTMEELRDAMGKFRRHLAAWLGEREVPDGST
jgi:hypothetical protein